MNDLIPGKLYKIYDVQEFPGHVFCGIAMYLKTTTNICVHHANKRTYNITMLNHKFLLKNKIETFSHGKSEKVWKFVLAK